MTSWRAIDVDVKRPRFAAAVTGLDLSRPLAGDVLREVRAAWSEHPVLCFPDQPLDLAQLEAFTQQIGPFGFDPFVAPMPGHPHVLEVRREASEKGIVFGGAWHSDWSFLASPPSATILHAKVIPPVGGDTLYVDCSLAFETLPADLREIALSRNAVHSAALAYGTNGALAKDPNPRAMTILHGEAAHDVQVHPMVRTHPVTGRRALFVNPVYTCGVQGLSDDEGRALLGRFYAHLLAERFVYRHRWSENMLLMWDNRCTLHNAEGGYQGHRRLLHRTTVAGEPPVLIAEA